MSDNDEYKRFQRFYDVCKHYVDELKKRNTNNRVDIEQTMLWETWKAALNIDMQAPFIILNEKDE